MTRSLSIATRGVISAQTGRNRPGGCPLATRGFIYFIRLVAPIPQAFVYVDLYIKREGRFNLSIARRKEFAAYIDRIIETDLTISREVRKILSIKRNMERNVNI